MRLGFLLALLGGASATAADGSVPESQSHDGTGTAPKVEGEQSAIDILEYRVHGNSVLEEGVIDDAVESYMGPHKAPADIEKARAALEKAYHDHGYQTIAVVQPRQDYKDGVVVLRVFESRVGHLTVVGSKYHTIEEIKDEAPSLAEGQVPNFNDVKKDIVALNQQPDRQVTPALQASATPGTVDVLLNVDDHLPVHGSIEINNRRSQDTSELRTIGTLSYDNLWQLGHSLTVSYQTAPQNPSDARIVYGSYLARFGASSFSLLLNAFSSNSNVATIGGTDVVGKGQDVSLRGIWILQGSDTLYQSLSAGFDYKHFKNFTSLGGDSFETPVTYFPFTIAYTGILRPPTATTQIDFSVSGANPKLGSTSSTYGLNRALARGQQFWVRGSLSRTEHLPWHTEGLLRIGGQWTDQNLITNEQMTVGGLDTLRGYLEAEALGDYGMNGTLEWRSPYLPSMFGVSSSRVVDDLRLFGFVDGAELRVREALPETPSQYNLLSMGMGLNLTLLGHFNGNLIWADPFLDGPATKSWASRVLFKVTGSF